MYNIIGYMCIMKRQDYTVSEVCIDKLNKLKKYLDITKSEIIRRAIDEYFDKHLKK